MITFKEFITEVATSKSRNVIKKWSSTSVGLRKTIDFLNANCKDGLKAIANDSLLYRGFTRAPSAGAAPAAVMDSSTGQRASRDTNNIYQLMMDASPALANVPSRSKSFICTTNNEYASNFGEIYVMIPVDGTKIAQVNSDDMFTTKIKSRLFSGSPEELSELLSDYFILLGASPTGRKFKSIDDLNSVMAKFSPELLIVLYLAVTGDTHMQSGVDITSSKVLNTAQISALLANAETVFARGGYKAMKSVIASLSSAPKNKRFNALSGMIFTPDSLSISMTKFGDKLLENKESWFSGKCIAIREDAFKEILTELIKQKFPVSSKLISTFDLDASNLDEDSRTI